MQELSDHLHSLVLSPSSVSVPLTEEGFVSLQQQTGLHDESALPQTSDNWRGKAIRRKLSKIKELILFVGGLPVNLDKTDYVKRLSLYNNKREDACIGPVFPDQGCVFISFTSGMAAASMGKALHDRKIFGRTPTLMFLPFISVPTGSPVSDPLLIFINSKSGGGQGKQLVEMMRGILNNNQVFLLELGGPMPGLYAFRKLLRFRILVCGGDGTVGWVLSALEQIHKHIQCKSPPIAVLPLGTGNDLARVLGFGSGWSGEGVANILHQVQEARPVLMNRWTIFFDNSPAQNQEPVKRDADKLDSILEDPVRDEQRVNTMVNGHKILQRTCKYNPQRSRVNIIMGMGDDTVWQTADKFNKSPEEEKLEFSDYKESNRKSNSEKENSNIVSLNKKEAATNSKRKSSMHVEANSESPVLASSILDKMISPPPISSEGKGDILTVIKKANEKFCDVESAAETPVQREAEDGKFSQKITCDSDSEETTVKTTLVNTRVPGDFELQTPEEGSKRFVDFKSSGSENDESSRLRGKNEDGVTESQNDKNLEVQKNESGVAACEENTVKTDVRGLQNLESKALEDSDRFDDFDSSSTNDHGSQVQNNQAEATVQRKTEDVKYRAKTTGHLACGDDTVKASLVGHAEGLQHFEKSSEQFADSESSMSENNENSEVLNKTEAVVADIQRKSVHRKLQISSLSDILESQDSVLQPLRQLTRVSAKCKDSVSVDKLENADDIIIKQGAVDDLVNEILQSEAPDVINDKKKLLALLTRDNTQSELSKTIETSKKLKAKCKGTTNSSSTENEHKDGNLPELEKLSLSSVDGESSKARAQTSAQERRQYFEPRKKMSLPLITPDRTYKQPEDCLNEISKETIGRRTKTTAGPKVVTMNNYFGLGVDAELSLYFHLAREENPEKFSSSPILSVRTLAGKVDSTASRPVILIVGQDNALYIYRFHNKAVYLKAGLKKMTSRSTQLNHIIELEVDGVKIPLPSVKGLVLLNISSWGSGANAWGSSASRRFQTPSFGDGLLEVIGVGGIAHMSQIYSGIRGGIRIAQGEYIKMHLDAEVAVQVDGEPWLQPPGQIAITVSPLQVTMLQKSKVK